MMIKKRRDSKGRVLKEGERERPNGTYEYRYQDTNGVRRSEYAKDLHTLREIEEEIEDDVKDGIDRATAKTMTLNDLYEVWKTLRKGLKNNTLQNYMYMYEQYAKDRIGKKKVYFIKPSDVRKFYNYVFDEVGLKITSIQHIQSVIHQAFDIAVNDGLIRYNPSDRALNELKRLHKYDSQKRKALTVAQEKLFFEYLSKNVKYNHWKNVFTILCYTGMRVGEATGLRWDDVDLANGLIDINHTLVYYPKGGHCRYEINSPKTENSNRVIPMIAPVKEAFEEIKKYQEQNGIRCKTVVDGYSDFIFVNKFGEVLNLGVLNKALVRIVRDCNEEQLEQHEGEDGIVLLPHFSCHTCRHTFVTRIIESGVSIKAVQVVTGHDDAKTTLDIYADLTNRKKAEEIQKFDAYIGNM